MKNQPYSFIGSNSSFEESNIVIFGVPFDGTTSFRSGTRFGPVAIRTESFGIETYSPYLDRDLLDYKIFDAGDLEVSPNNIQYNLDLISQIAENIFANKKIPIMLGGEHLITLGAIIALKKIRNDINIIHFDAHADLRDDYLGEKLSHACVMCRCFEQGANIFSFGIRSGDRTEFQFAEKHTHMQKFNFDGLKEICKKLENVYLSIDLDILDPAYFCGTGTPEAGGVSFNELNSAIQTVAKNSNIIGADLVELSPHYDQSGASTAVACKILRELILTVAS
ncbi:agmatinase [Clostridia bacterium]|nr:agmatinase [Clostridia bacterium]